MPLTALAVRNALPAAKIYKLADGGGLYLEVHPNGARYWRLKYRIHGKEKRLALGVYPEVSLADAREGREKARRLLRDGVDPGVVRKVEKLRAKHAAELTFDGIANEWLSAQRHELSSATYAKKRWICDQLLFPWLAGRPVDAIEPAELLAVLRRTESRGKLESVHRAKQLASAVFRYAIWSGRATRDPAADLRGALRASVPSKRAAITDPKLVGPLMRQIHGYAGNFVTCAALKLAPLLFVRPGELRGAEWAEFSDDLFCDSVATGVMPVWRIPAGRMKMREEHLVPLSSQAVVILRELHAVTGRGRYVFPSVRSSTRPLSENTINAALRALGFDKQTMTGHGFRAMASTILNEQGYPPDVIERQLAHAERSKSRKPYNRAEYLSQRRTMMQAWADYLDGLRLGASVVSLGARQRVAS